jgi:hypothetical protein
MKGVLIGVDFLKDTDGSFKILELNTGVGFVFSNPLPYFNKSELDDLISENNIDEIDLVIIHKSGVYVNDNELVGKQTTFHQMMKDLYSGHPINVYIVNTDTTSVPNIVDEPNRLTIRQAYDSTALIDDTYAKDNFQFLKLMYDGDPSSIAKTYFNHPTLGIDSIGDDIRDNGNYPNFIVKERYPTRNYTEYPKIYKISSVEELQDLKSNLPSNTILQEFIFNPNDLENGKIKTYRVISMVYGPNLDILNLFHPFIHTNSCTIDTNVDYFNGQLQSWEKPKYQQKAGRILSEMYISDDNNYILKSDNTVVRPNQLSIGDPVKTVILPNLVDGDSIDIIAGYSGTTESIFSGSSFSTSTVQNIYGIENEMWVKNIYLENGIKFSDVNESLILINRNDIVRFAAFSGIKIGDEIILVNSATDEFEKKLVVDTKYQFTKETIYNIDVEDSDIYLTAEETTQSPNYFVIQHNAPQCRCWIIVEPWFMWYCEIPCGGNPGDPWFTGMNRGECESMHPYERCQQPCCVSEPIVDEGGYAFPADPNCPECDVILKD